MTLGVKAIFKLDKGSVRSFLVTHPVLMEPNPVQVFCFADLPQDIGRSIFQITAELDEESGRSCALVSKEINIWCVL